jgi:hypothetical protein
LAIQIEGLQAKPGEKVFGYVKIGETPISSISLPVGIVNGKEEGPRIFIMAGTHPCEYPGIEAAVRIFKQTDPQDLRGSIVDIPVANPTGFERRTAFVNPLDDINQAFVFPGNKTDSMSYRIDDFLLGIALRSQYLLNLHGGDVPEHLFRFSIVETVGKEPVDSESFKLARLYGAPYIIKRTPNHPGTLEYQVALKGIPGIVGEAGSLAMLDEADVQVHMRGVANIMKSLKMIGGSALPPISQSVISDGWKIRANRGGLFQPKVRPGDIVTGGQLLAEIRDLKGDVLESVRSPKPGLILYTTLRHVTNTGDPLFSLGTPTPI